MQGIFTPIYKWHVTDFDFHNLTVKQSLQILLLPVSNEEIIAPDFPKWHS